jgi:hypothetical protein
MGHILGTFWAHFGHTMVILGNFSSKNTVFSNEKCQKSPKFAASVDTETLKLFKSTAG